MSSTPRAARVRLPALLAPLAVVLTLSLAAPSSVAHGAPPAAAPAPAAPPPAAPASPASFKVASFNILGSQHTGRSSRYASGRKRARMARQWLFRHNVSVTGMSEAQRNQIAALTRRTKLTSFPRLRRSTNTQTAQSVVWRSDRFALVKGRTFTIPFHYTQQREQPVVLLRHRRTGKKVWVISTHFTHGKSRRATYERHTGINRMVREIRKRQRTGFPVIATGDMNSHRRVFCRVVGRTALRAPLGGSVRNGRCSPPRGTRIDWLFGSARLRWAGYRFAHDRTVDKITDHTVPVGRVTW